MARLTSLLRFTLFPGWLLIVGISALLAYRAGWSPAIIVTTVGAVTLFVVSLLERLLPFRPDWNESHGAALTDIASFGVIAGLADPVLKIVGAALAMQLAAHLRQYAVPLFPASGPIYLQIAQVFLIAEFGKYWAHRWHHENRFLWDLHAMHHSPERPYAFNNVRLHPLNHAMSMLPLAVIGVPSAPLLVYSSIAIAVSFFQHANLDLAFGPLNYVFSTNALHRWHHSSQLPEGNRNYGSTLIIWDLLFDTHHLPRDAREPARIGISEPNYPLRRYVMQLLWPFRLRCCPATS